LLLRQNARKQANWFFKVMLCIAAKIEYLDIKKSLCMRLPFEAYSFEWKAHA